MLRYSIKHLLFYSEALWVNSSGITLFTQADSIIDQNMMMAIFFPLLQFKQIVSLFFGRLYRDCQLNSIDIYISHVLGRWILALFYFYHLWVNFGALVILHRSGFSFGSSKVSRFGKYSNSRSIFFFPFSLYLSFCFDLSISNIFPVNERKKLKNGQADTERERACVCCKCWFYWMASILSCIRCFSFLFSLLVASFCHRLLLVKCSFP